MMMIPSGSDASFVLALIPPAHRKSHQIAVTEHGEKLPTYKFLRAPATINELEAYKVVVAMDNETLVCINQAAMPSTKCKKYLELSSSVTTIKIFGNSDDAIVETAVFFGTLGGSAVPLTICYNDALKFDAARAEQLALLLQPQRKIVFRSSFVNKFLCEVLATRPHRIDLGFEKSVVDFAVFMDCLEARTAPFGALSLGDTDLERRRLFDHLWLFEHLQMERLPYDLILRLLAAPMKSIGFTVGRMTGQMDVGAAEIVPKAIHVDIVSAEYPTPFMDSFFHRLAETRHLEHLTVSLRGHTIIPVPAAQAFVQAVRNNSHLKHFEFMARAEHQLGNCMKDLFLALEKHKGLRTLSLSSYPVSFDPRFGWLKQLLTCNRYLEVFIECEPMKSDYRLYKICELNRVVRGSKMLQEAPTATRSLLFGPALTQDDDEECCFQHAALLLTDHVDILCDLLHAVVPTSEVEAVVGQANMEDGELLPAAASMANGENSNGQKRKRETDEM